MIPRYARPAWMASFVAAAKLPWRYVVDDPAEPMRRVIDRLKHRPIFAGAVSQDLTGLPATTWTADTPTPQRLQPAPRLADTRPSFGVSDRAALPWSRTPAGLAGELP